MEHAHYSSTWSVKGRTVSVMGQPQPHNEFKANLGYLSVKKPPALRFVHRIHM